MDKYLYGIFVGLKPLVDIHLGHTCDVLRDSDPRITKEKKESGKAGMTFNEEHQLLVRWHGQKLWRTWHRSWIWLPSELSYPEHFEKYSGKYSGIFV